MKHLTKTLAALALAASCTPAPAQSNDWTTFQKTAYTAGLIAHVADWGQTRRISKEPNRWSELNPLLGKHPSTSAVNNYFIATGALMAVLPHVSPWYRKNMMGPVSMVLIVNASRNHLVGLRVSF